MARNYATDEMWRAVVTTVYLGPPKWSTPSYHYPQPRLIMDTGHKDTRVLGPYAKPGTAKSVAKQKTAWHRSMNADAESVGNPPEYEITIIIEQAVTKWEEVDRL